MTDLSRQATSAFDKAFQKLFTLVTEVVELYRQRETIDGPMEAGDRLMEIPSKKVEECVKSYKNRFDQSGPDMHVDVVLELYAKVRSFLLRGYQCDSWLRTPESVLYYGVSASEAGDNVVYLDCVFLMLEALKRSEAQVRNQASVLRVKFGYQLYAVFVACLNYSRHVESATKVRGVTPEVDVEDDVKTLESLQTEILNDLPKSSSSGSTAAGPATGNPFAGMFPGGLTDVVGSLLQTLPSITRTVTDTVSRTTGTPINENDRQMIDSTLSNITNLLGNPDGMKSLLADFSSGPDGISRFVQKLITPPSEAASAPPQVEGPYKE